MYVCVVCEARIQCSRPFGPEIFCLAASKKNVRNAECHGKAARHQTIKIDVTRNAVENGEPLTDLHSVTPGSSVEPFG